MPARVLYRDAQGRTGEVALNPDEPCYIGRALDCAVRTDDAMVSRKHSLIRGEGDRYLVEDLGSSNGTHVNDVKVARQTLNHNDVVRCGNLWLRFVDDSPADAVPARPADASPSSRYRNTLGGKSEPAPAPSAPAVSAESVTEPPADPPPPPPKPALVASAPKPATASSPPAAPVSPTVMPVDDDPPPPVERTRTPTPAPVAPVIRPDVRGKPLPHRPQTPHAQPLSSDKPTGPASVDADDASGPSRKELERRLANAGERARELERGLLTLQAELNAAQEKIKALLRGVQELTGRES